jgi:hypothetical protein
MPKQPPSPSKMFSQALHLTSGTSQFPFLESKMQWITSNRMDLRLELIGINFWRFRVIFLLITHFTHNFLASTLAKIVIQGNLLFVLLVGKHQLIQTFWWTIQTKQALADQLVIKDTQQMEILIRSVLHVIQAVALVMTVVKLETFLIAFNVVQAIHLD